MNLLHRLVAWLNGATKARCFMCGGNLPAIPRGTWTPRGMVFWCDPCAALDDAASDRAS